MSRVKEHRLASVLGRCAERILLIGAIAVAVTLFFTKWMVPVTVAGTSMSPSLNDGEIVLSDKLYRYGRGLKRGDLVAVRSDDGSLFIRRVIGMPGETLDIVDGAVYIDGCPLTEPYLAEPEKDVSLEPVTVPQGMYLLLSDDRADTGDSRNAAIGMRSMDSIEGLIRFRVSPLREMNIFC